MEESHKYKSKPWNLCFQFRYDANKDGVLDRDEFERMCTQATLLAGFAFSQLTGYDYIHPEDGYFSESTLSAMGIAQKKGSVISRSNVRPGPEEDTISSIPKEPPDTKM